MILTFNHGKYTLLADLLTLWAVLEGYVNKKKITRIGVSDIGTDLFIALYSNSIVSLLFYLHCIVEEINNIIFIILKSLINCLNLRLSQQLFKSI